jgi:DNA-binding response OmpR family regulator
MVPGQFSPLTTASGTLPSVLIVDPELIAARYEEVLRQAFVVSTTTRFEMAQRFIERNPPAFIITEWQLEDGTGADLCRVAHSLSVPASVIVTTADPEHAPAALEAGCDSLLLKPFAPNLLSARLGRMLRVRANGLRLRDRSSMLRTRGETERTKDHFMDRKEMRKAGSIVEWAHAPCPHCAHSQIVSFEHSSMRRDWFTCEQCRKVWLAKRRE